MPNPPLTDEQCLEAVKAWKSANCNTSETARRLGIRRSSVQHRLKIAEDRGLVEQSVIQAANPPAHRPIDGILSARREEFRRRRERGSWRKPVLISLQRPGPYVLIVLGDPHLDNPGTDLDEWDKWTEPVCAPDGIFATCIGDYLDNWAKPLAHIYGEAETSAPEGWVILEHYLERLRGGLIASCSGNHDDWSGYSDILGHLMRRNGTAHKKGGIRLYLQSPGCEVVKVSMRHKFKGQSIYNPAHGVARAARFGWRDDILVGGHIHTSGEQKVVHPDGEISHCFQIAAFKKLDSYADVHGFMEERASPAVAFVVDPRRPQPDAERVKAFFDPEAAISYRDAIA